MNRATNYRGEGGGCPLRGTKLIPYLTSQCVGERKWLGQRPNQPVPSVSPVWAIYPAIGNPDTKEQMRNAFIGPFMAVNNFAIDTLAEFLVSEQLSHYGGSANKMKKKLKRIIFVE